MTMRGGTARGSTHRQMLGKFLEETRMTLSRRTLHATRRDLHIVRTTDISTDRLQGEGPGCGNVAGHPGRDAVRRTAPIAASLLAAALLAAACSSSGTHTQTPGPSSPTGDPSTTPMSVSSSSAPTTHPRTTPATKPIPTPTVTAPAQAAVDSYVHFLNITTAADRDPRHANTSDLDKYATGQALSVIRESIENMRSHGLAYRGSAPDPRVKVGVVGSATTVVLSSCPLQSSTDPFVQYNIATGKAISETKRTPPPPYLRVLTMHLVGGNWKLASIATNASKTCTG